MASSPGLSFSFTDPAGSTTSPVTDKGASFRRWYGDVWGSEVVFTVPVSPTRQLLSVFLGTVNGSRTTVRATFDGTNYTTLENGRNAIESTTGVFAITFRHPTATAMTVRISQNSSSQHGANYLVVGGAALSSLGGTSAYDQWSASVNWEAVPVDLRDPEDDADGDGDTNLVEMGFGQNPTLSDSSGYPQTGTTFGGGGEITFTLSYPKASPSMTYEMQHSTTLASESWSGDGVSAETFNASTGLFERSYTAPEGTDGMFFRLLLTLP